jgi:hypothetical protein
MGRKLPAKLGCTGREIAKLWLWKTLLFEN